MTRATLQNYKATWTSLLTNEKAKSTFTRRLLRPSHPLTWALDNIYYCKMHTFNLIKTRWTLFADLVGFYTHWTYVHIFRHIFLSNYWCQKSDILLQASYRYPISWEAFLNPSDSYFLFADRVQKRFPQYGIPIWSLWPNIRFLSSIVA
jgi:hypothetical protein